MPCGPACSFSTACAKSICGCRDSVMPSRRPELERALMFIVGLERFGQFPDIVAAHERGEIPPTVAWGACPSLFDPTQAPPDRHVAFLWEKLPYALRGNAANWDAERDAH